MFQVIGDSIPRKDALEKVTGAAIYAGDLKFPGQLWARFFWSPYPHARILQIDTRRALSVAGVKAIVTGEDVPFRHGFWAIQDQPFLAVDRVRYVGEPVVGIAAETLEAAEEAVGRLKVEFEPLPAVFEPLAAMRPDAPLLHENFGEYTCTEAVQPVPGTNICNHTKLRKGDVEEGFRQSDLLLEEVYCVPMVQHAPLETHAAVAKFEPDGRVNIWTSAQSPFYTRGELARALEVPMDRVRIICPRVGGGFGSKHEMRVEHLAVAVSMKTNFRPVKVVLTREEEFVSTLVRMPVRVQIKSGIQRDGTLVAQKIIIHWDTGAYSGLGPLVARNAGFGASGPYVIPHIHMDSFCLYTNNPLGGAYRGLGVPEVSWARESHLDNLARRLGMDPLELRLRNALEEGSISAMGEKALSVGVKECLRRAAQGVDWKERTRGAGGKLRGKGLACMYKMTGTPSSSSVIVRLNEDGTAQILQSAVEIGQGVETVISQIVAEELGIPVEKIRVAQADTDYTPYERSTTSSRSTFHTGNAAREAARDVKRQLLEWISPLWEIEPDRLDISGGKIIEKGGKGRGMEIEKLWSVGVYTQNQFPIVGRGTYSSAGIFDPIDAKTGQSRRAAAFWTYAAQAAEVEVDTETGRVRILKFAAAHDTGQPINRMTCEQQIEGALVMGLGTALFEEMILQEGRVVNANFVDYKLPTSMDLPGEIEPILVAVPHPEGPFGAKGLGEPGLAPTAPAIANAIYDALGVRIRDLPITPDKVWKELRSGGSQLAAKSRGEK